MGRGAGRQASRPAGEKRRKGESSPRRNSPTHLCSPAPLLACWPAPLPACSPAGLRACNSVSRPSAGQIEHRSGAEGTVGRAEPGHERGGFLLQSESPHWNLGQHIVDVFLGDLLEDVGLDDGGGNAVDEDAGGGEFLPQGFGERDDASLGRAVVGGIGIALLAGNGGDIDDPPVTARHHAGNDLAATEEDGGQIHIDDLAPLFRRHFPGFFGDAGNAGIVDQNVDGAEAGEGGGGGGFDGSGVGEVDDGGVRFALALENPGGSFEGVRVEVPQGAPRAGAEEALCNGETDAASAAGDDGGLAFEVDLVHMGCCAGQLGSSAMARAAPSGSRVRYLGPASTTTRAATPRLERRKSRFWTPAARINTPVTAFERLNKTAVSKLPLELLKIQV